MRVARGLQDAKLDVSRDIWSELHDVVCAGNTVVHIRGANFGSAVPPSVTFVLPENKETGVLEYTFPSSAILRSNDSDIVVLSPAGVDDGNGTIVVVTTPDQHSITSGGSRRYFIDGPLLEAAVVVGGRMPIAGGARVEVFGQNLYGGLPSVLPQVFIGGGACTVVRGTVTLSSLACTAPPGVGANVSVTVVLLGRSQTCACTIDYDPPCISAISPTSGDARLAIVLDIYGLNFNAQSAVTVEGGNCAALEPKNASHLVCTMRPGMTRGYHGVRVFSATQGSNTVELNLVCGVNYYAPDGALCAACPDGGQCDGGVAMPYPQLGWYQVDTVTFVACAPPAACRGGLGSPCADGYMNERCKDCAFKYYRLQDACTPCPSFALLYIAIFLVVVVMVVAIAYWLNKKRVNLAALSIGIDFMQVIAMFAAFNFKWPPLVVGVFSAVSAAAFNLQALAPECAMQFSVIEKWLILQSMPFVLLGTTLSAAAAAATVEWVQERYKRRKNIYGVVVRRKRGVQSAATLNDTLFGVFFAGLYYVYFSCVRNSMTIFNCTLHSGTLTVSSEPSVLCTMDDPVYAYLYPWSVACICVYGLGIPCIFVFVLRTYRNEIRADQVLRASGVGDDAGENPQLFVRKRYQKLYNDFRPEFFYWRLVMILRKFLLVMCSTFFSRDPMLQASVAVMIMFFSYVIQAATRPFLMRLPTSASSLQSVAAEIGEARAARLSYVFDYNTLENALLITSTMTLMGGMIFSSVSMDVGADSPAFLGVAAAVVIMILTAVAGFVAMLLREIYRSFQFALITAAIEDKRSRTITVVKNARYSGKALAFTPSVMVPLVPRKSMFARKLARPVGPPPPLVAGGAARAQTSVGGAGESKAAVASGEWDVAFENPMHQGRPPASAAAAVAGAPPGAAAAAVEAVSRIKSPADATANPVFAPSPRDGAGNAVVSVVEAPGRGAAAAAPAAEVVASGGGVNGHWLEYWDDVNGFPYYGNVMTGEVVWEPPAGWVGPTSS
jgi:hypothetical protein